MFENATIDFITDELSDPALVITGDERVNTRPFWVTKEYPHSQMVEHPSHDDNVKYVNGVPYQEHHGENDVIEHDTDDGAIRADLHAAPVGSVLFSFDNHGEGVDLAYIKVSPDDYLRTLQYAAEVDWMSEHPKYIELTDTDTTTVVSVDRNTAVPVLVRAVELSKLTRVRFTDTTTAAVVTADEFCSSK